MYREFFGFAEKPFTLTPNPRFIFLSKTHREVFAHLLYGIRNHAGFIEVIGEVGTGKTTVLRALFEQLGGEGYRLAFIFNPSLSALELLRGINREFGLAADGLSPGELLAKLNEFLLHENDAGRTVVLVIDEAQNLAPAVLEQIRLLSNLETETDKLIQIVLVGQPELGHVLNRAELRQLSQRITVRYHLKELDFEDTQSYIAHRLSVAGCRQRTLFSADAIKKIYRRSGGLPRLINVLCDRSLLVAYVAEAPQVIGAMVTEAARELRRETLRSPRRHRRMFIAAAAALLGTVVMVLVVAIFFRSNPLPPVNPAVATSNPPIAFTLTSSFTRMSPEKGAAAGIDALLLLWGRDVSRREAGLTIPQALTRAAAASKLNLLRFRGPWSALRQLDAPALLELTLPGTTAIHYVALLAIDGDFARLEPPLAVTATVPVQELEALYAGQAYILWRNPLQLPIAGGHNMERGAVVALQRLLLDAGVYQGALHGRFDEATTTALVSFQQRRGLAADGQPGPQTLLALYQSSGRYGFPRLAIKTGGGQ